VRLALSFKILLAGSELTLPAGGTMLKLAGVLAPRKAVPETVPIRL
jgi:hypothetical protein